MPLISEFFGIKIYIYWNDHLPPHIHAYYGENQILVGINEVAVIKGVFPFSKLKLVLAWCELHKDELMDNWKRAERNMDIHKIEPLK